MRASGWNGQKRLPDALNAILRVALRREYKIRTAAKMPDGGCALSGLQIRRAR